MENLGHREITSMTEKFPLENPFKTRSKREKANTKDNDVHYMLHVSFLTHYQIVFTQIFL